MLGFSVTALSKLLSAPAIWAQRPMHIGLGSHGLRYLERVLSVVVPTFDAPLLAKRQSRRGTPDGRFLYASELTSSTTSAFRVDAESGHITPLGSVPTEKQPRGFAIDPSGHVLIAAGELSNAMSVYAIDPASGALKLRQSIPVGKKPNWVEFASFD